MPWQCNICGDFSAEHRSQLINHIGRCHRNDPNFHCLCGISGCTRTFKSYYTWRKHVKKEHSSQPNNVEEHTNVRNNNENDENGGVVLEENIDTIENTRLAALYILKIQEEFSMPKTTVTSIIENTKSLIQDTLKTVETQVKR